MKINKFQTLDFQGLAGTNTWNFEQINILCRENKTGKSSLLNAVKYGLSGQEPTGILVHAGAQTSAVGMTLEDGTQIIRQKNAAGKSTCFLDRHKVSKKLLDKAISDRVHIPMNSIRVASSEDVFRTLKPQEFGELILSYTEDQLDTKTVSSFIPEMTTGMREEVNKRLPSGLFGIDTIQGFYKQLNEDRLTMKRAINEREGAVKVLRNQTPPDKTKEELLEEEKKLAALLKESTEYTENLNKYNKAKKLKENHDNMIAGYKRQIAEISANKRPIEEREKMLSELNKERETLLTANSVLASQKKTRDDTKHILETIDTAVCPLSSKLTCTTDKTPVKKELEEILKETEEGIKKQNALVESINKDIQKLTEEINAFDKEQEAARKKEFLTGELAKVESQVIEVPEEPKKPSVTNVESKLTEVRKQLHIIEDFKKADKICGILERGYKKLDDFENLKKAFEPKGTVMTRITEKYMTAFEEVCNEKAEALSPGMRLKFHAANGVYVFIDTNGDGNYLNYESLSGGEKALYIFLMLDLLNTLSGLKVLIIDELSVLDKDAFTQLIRLIMDHKDEYDHVFLSMVNHDDTIDVLKTYGLSPNL